MVREDLINSAISFLQDPSVASAPLEKRIAFLQSKNLTQEEIDVSLARAGEDPASAPPSAPPSSPPPNYAYRQPTPPPPGYGGYQQGSYWGQPPPPELPKRDWRDWFIMATVMGGVSYGLYFTAKRYIIPLIKPPTPPQLEQDKASIDESFNRAFALLDQLNTDTEALKASEEARTARLDTALGEMESVLAGLKESSKRRDEDSRRVEDDVRGLRDLIPKALDAQKEATDHRLKDLGNELKSLKTLVANRMTTPTAGATGTVVAGRTLGAGVNMFGSQGTVSTANGSGAATPVQAPSTGVDGLANGSSAASTTVAATDGQSSGSALNAVPARSQTSTPYSRLANGRASIPAWQMAAAKNSQAKEEEKKDTSESGTATEAGSA